MDWAIQFGDKVGGDSSQIFGEFITSLAKFIWKHLNPSYKTSPMAEVFVDDQYGCSRAMFLIILWIFHKTGMVESDEKRCEPSSQAEILGIRYDLIDWVMTLPDDKRKRYQEYISNLVEKRWISKFEVEKVVGILSYATHFTNTKSASIQFLLGCISQNKKRASFRGIPVSGFLKHELSSWSEALKRPLTIPISLDQTCQIYTDAAIPTESCQYGGLGFYVKLPSVNGGLFGFTICKLTDAIDKEVLKSTTAYELMAINWAVYTVFTCGLVPNGLYTIGTDSQNSTFLKGSKLSNAQIISDLVQLPLSGLCKLELKHLSCSSAEIEKADALSRFYQAPKYEKIVNEIFMIDPNWINVSVVLPVTNFPFSRYQRSFPTFYTSQRAQMEAKHLVQVCDGVQRVSELL